MPMILSIKPQNFRKNKIKEISTNFLKREIPFGSSEEYWAMNESLTQLMKNSLAIQNLEIIMSLNY